MRIKGIWDWFRDRIFCRHHVLKLSCGYGWRDTDTKLLYAAFDLLTAFVEKEKPFAHVDWDAEEGTKAAADEFMFLYNWWRNVRPTRKDPLDEMDIPERAPGVIEVDDKGHKFYRQGEMTGDPEKIKAYEEALIRSANIEEEWYNEDTEMLIRLIKIREYLWT